MEQPGAKRDPFRRGAVWNMLGSAMFGANSLLLLMLVSRATGSESAAGRFSVAFTTAQLLYMLGLFGANHFQMTDYRERFPFSAYRGLKTLTNGLMLLAFAGAALLFRYDREKTLLTALLTLYMLTGSAAELYQSLFFQKNRLDLSGQSVFFRTLCATLAFAAVLLPTGNVLWASAAMALTGAAGLWLFGVRRAGPFLPDKPARAGRAEVVGEGSDSLQTLQTQARAEVVSLAQSCFPLFASTFLMNAILACPKYAMERYRPGDPVGVFSMLFILVQIVNLVCSFVYNPALKSIAACVTARDRGKLMRLLGLMTAVVAGTSLLGAAACWLIGPELLSWFYGTDLTAYRLALIGVIACGGLLAYSQLYYYTLVIVRAQRWILVNYLLATAAAALAAWPMTRFYGMAGAILAFLAAHILLIALQAATLSRALRSCMAEGKEQPDA